MGNVLLVHSSLCSSILPLSVTMAPSPPQQSASVSPLKHISVLSTYFNVNSSLSLVVEFVLPGFGSLSSLLTWMLMISSSKHGMEGAQDSLTLLSSPTFTSALSFKTLNFKVKWSHYVIIWWSFCFLSSRRLFWACTWVVAGSKCAKRKGLHAVSFAEFSWLNKTRESRKKKSALTLDGRSCKVTL